MKPWVVRAPDHLGDGIMARPTVAALAQKNSLLIVAPQWGAQVYPFNNITHYPIKAPLPSADLAVLLKPSFGCAWRFRKYPQSIGIAYNHRGWLLSTSLAVVMEHRIDSYARIGRRLGVTPNRTPSWPCTQIPRSSLDVLLVVGTASPKTVRYRHLVSFAKKLTSQWNCLAVGGPGDEDILAELAPHIPTLASQTPLDTIANYAASARWTITLDSGLGHLVAAARYFAGLPSASTLVVYGSTDPTQTGPRHTTAITPKDLDCWPCYAKTCTKGTPCLEHDLEHIARHLK